MSYKRYAFRVFRFELMMGAWVFLRLLRVQQHCTAGDTHLADALPGVGLILCRAGAGLLFATPCEQRICGWTWRPLVRKPLRFKDLRKVSHYGPDPIHVMARMEEPEGNV